MLNPGTTYESTQRRHESKTPANLPKKKEKKNERNEWNGFHGAIMISQAHPINI